MYSMWSCASAPCGCAVPVQYAPVDCLPTLLCAVLFSSNQAVLQSTHYVLADGLAAKTGQSSPIGQLAVSLHGPPSSPRH